MWCHSRRPGTRFLTSAALFRPRGLLQVLQTGEEIKLQRNALHVVQFPTGHEAVSPSPLPAAAPPPSLPPIVGFRPAQDLIPLPPFSTPPPLQDYSTSEEDHHPVQLASSPARQNGHTTAVQYVPQAPAPTQPALKRPRPAPALPEPEARRPTLRQTTTMVSLSATYIYEMMYCSMHPALSPLD